MFAQSMSGFLVWFDKLDRGGYVTLTLALVTAYLASNVIQKYNDGTLPNKSS